MNDRSVKYPLKRLAGILLFLLISSVLNAQIYYPWRDTYVGSLDAKGWGGLVLVPHPESGFAFRLRVRKGEEIADGIDLFFLASEVGPHSPDGQYARIRFDLELPFGKAKETPILIKPAPKAGIMTVEWSRQDERTVVGRIRIPARIELQLVHYFPWDFQGEYRIDEENRLAGESDTLQKQHYILWTDKSPESITPASGDDVVLTFPSGKDNEVYFIAGVGSDSKELSNHIYRYKNNKAIASILSEESQRYEKKRVKIDGLFKGIPEAVTNNIFWMTLYQAGRHRLYSPAGRRWIFPRPDGGSDHWTLFEWDSFFNALEAVVESTKHARDIVRSVLETQYPNGNIPNWRGRFGGTPDRSQPPVGSYVVLKLFQKIGDIEILENAYPYLKKWHDFWTTETKSGHIRRDGNGDGLLEWGSDRELVKNSVPEWEEGATGKTRAMWESGQDDLPNWDDAGFEEKSGTLSMNCLDLNSLYALDCWCLSQIAGILGQKPDSRQLLEEYENMKTLINERLWDDREGFYFDRHWDGRFSNRKAASNFYPLLAQIPDRARAMRMMKHLLNEEEFWGEFVIPTISRDDKDFKDQQYWRGTIWPPTNYLVYQGLKAYHFDAIAAEFAKKSAELFLRSWKNYQLCPENYDSRTGEAGGQRYQSWGPLFGLVALEEYLDFNPWEGFRFGFLGPQRGRLSRISVQGRHYDLEISRKKVVLREEGKVVLETKGRAIFRHFLYSPNEISFEIKSLKPRKINVNFLAKGKYQLLIDDEVTRIFSGKSTEVKVPAGEHAILILLLEKER